jgi:mannose-6-phosphate isomerase-like protein (cupin superfamily)/DNA-binding XRE family transcriptional regulator
MREDGAAGARNAGLGASLRRIREMRGLGVRELARRTDLSPSLISRVERGAATPSVATLFVLQSALEVSVAELLGEAVGQPPAAPAHDGRGGGDGRRGHGRHDRQDGHGGPAARPAGHPYFGIVSEGVQRAGTRKAIDLGNGVRWERLTPGPDGLQFTYNVYEPGGSSSEPGTFLRHAGREYGYVIAGRLSVTLGSETHVLGPGDSIAFDSSVPHRLFNDGDVDVVSIWVAIAR